MAIDNKYGRVTLEHGTIGEDEPVVVFRAQDLMLPKVLMYYHLFCLKAGSPRHHLNLILDTLDKVVAWQEHDDQSQPRGYIKGVFRRSSVRVPTSDDYAKRIQLEESLRRGLAQSAAGETHDLGSFAPYAEEEEKA